MKITKKKIGIFWYQNGHWIGICFLWVLLACFTFVVIWSTKRSKTDNRTEIQKLKAYELKMARCAPTYDLQRMHANNWFRLDKIERDKLESLPSRNEGSKSDPLRNFTAEESNEWLQYFEDTQDRK